MKNIVPALNKLQLACMDRKAPLSAIAVARKELFAAIREAMVGFAPGQEPIIKPETARYLTEYLAQFDKLNSQ